jgi:hypothetical protein
MVINFLYDTFHVKDFEDSKGLITRCTCRWFECVTFHTFGTASVAFLMFVQFLDVIVKPTYHIQVPAGKNPILQCHVCVERNHCSEHRVVSNLCGKYCRQLYPSVIPLRQQYRQAANQLDLISLNDNSHVVANLIGDLVRSFHRLRPHCPRTEKQEENRTSRRTVMVACLLVHAKHIRAPHQRAADAYRNSSANGRR